MALDVFAYVLVKSWLLDSVVRTHCFSPPVVSERIFMFRETIEIGTANVVLASVKWKVFARKFDTFHKAPFVNNKEYVRKVDFYHRSILRWLCGNYASVSGKIMDRTPFMVSSRIF